jgi:hypothetical protein
MFTPTGIITPVRVNELIPRECFCMLYAHWTNLFGMRAVLCLLPATCALYHNVWFFGKIMKIIFMSFLLLWGHLNVQQLLEWHLSLVRNITLSLILWGSRTFQISLMGGKLTIFEAAPLFVSRPNFLRLIHLVRKPHLEKKHFLLCSADTTGNS